MLIIETKIKTIFLSFILIILFFSCKNQQIERSLAQANNLIDIYPDSALAILESVDFPTTENTDQFAEYMLLLVSAKEKSGESIAEDTSIVFAAEHFLKARNIPKAASAYFYASRVFNNLQQIEKATKLIIKAKDLACQTDDNNLQGLIFSDLGELYKNQFQYSQAIDAFRSAQKYFSLADNKGELYCVDEQIGNVYLLKQPLLSDSVNFYYNRAIDYASSQNDTLSLARILKNIGIHLKESGNYGEAKSFLLKSIQIKPDGKQTLSCYYVLSQIFLESNKIDSTLFYSDVLLKSMDQNNLEDQYLYHLLMYKIFKDQKKYDLALESYEQYIKYDECISKNAENKSILRLQAKYNEEKIENAKHELTIYRQYIYMFISAIIIILAFSILRMKMKEKKLLDSEKTIEIQKRMLSYRDEVNNRFKYVLLEKLDIVKELTKLDLYNLKGEKEYTKKHNQIINKHLQNTLNWQNLYPVINDLYDGFVEKINEMHPDFTEKEKQMCCLIRAGFQVDEIGIILSYKYESVRVLKSKLCKKMGFSSMNAFVMYLSTLKNVA